jgi:hypothetical protein
MLALAPAAAAQSDYRNLDPGRPLAVEDAQPLEFRAMEFSWTLPRYLRSGSGLWHLSFEGEYKWGIAKNTQVGVTSELGVQRAAGRAVAGAADVQLHLLHNFNAETPRLPAIAVRPEFTIRAGGFGSQREHAALKWILTKTLGRNRLHLNGSYAAGPTAAPGRGGDLVSRFFYGVGYERTLPLRFLVLLADVYARKPIDHDRTQVVFDVGARVQLNPAWVLDAGISSGALRRSAGHDFGFTIGVSRAFSFRGLFPTRGTAKTRTP